MLNLNLIKIAGRLLVVVRHINFQPLNNLFLGNCFDFFLYFLNLSKISASFEQILPLIVETLYSHHRFKVSFFFRIELHWNSQYLVYLCQPLVSSCGPWQFKVAMLVLSKADSHALSCVFWIGIFEPDHL